MTTQQNEKLLVYLDHYKKSCARTDINVALTARIGMPNDSGRKGVVSSTDRRSSPELAIGKRVKRLYSQRKIP